MKKTLQAKEVIDILVGKPKDKVLAELAGSKEANIRTLRSQGSKTYDGYLARWRISEIEKLVNGRN